MIGNPRTSDNPVLAGPAAPSETPEVPAQPDAVAGRAISYFDLKKSDGASG
jgi:hypothetical protein